MFPEIEPVTVDPIAIAAFKSEADFMVLAVDLLREAASYVCISACIMGEQPTWDRDKAVVGGNAVRLYKLLSALLDQVCQRRRETADIFLRLVFETCVTIRYLLKFWSSDLVESYIRVSLRHERKLRDRILANIADRGGDKLPIEKRMLQSLERTARIAGIALDEIDLTRKAAWGGKHLAQKAADIGWANAYDAVFGGMSHNVHGSWQDLYAHHFEVDEDGRFTPELGRRLISSEPQPH